jgi:hypothetical protein
MKAYDKKVGLSTLKVTLGGLGIVGGIWMLVAPFVLNYAGATTLDAKTKKLVPVDLTAVTVSDIVAGVLIVGLVAFALSTANNTAMAKLRLYAGIATVVVGVYLVAVPYIFDLLDVANYMSLDKPNTNDQLIGILTIVLAGFAVQNEFYARKDEETEAKLVGGAA